MGYGTYSHEAHLALTAPRRGQPSEQVFRQGGLHPLLNPLGLRWRESRDSEEHPCSLALFFALDVSGSMGEIPARLAAETLPGFFRLLLELGLADPQVLFAAVGNARSDRAPLQIGQFESSAEAIDSWLVRLYLEGGGSGGNESYELAFYFAARHVAMDCWERRGRRGYLFVTGDESPNPYVSRREVAEILGDSLDRDLPLEGVLDEVAERFEVFFLIPPLAEDPQARFAWQGLLGDRVVLLGQPEDTAWVAASLVALTEGVVDDLPELAARLAGAGAERATVGRVVSAVARWAVTLGRSGWPDPEEVGEAPPADAGWLRARS